MREGINATALSIDAPHKRTDTLTSQCVEGGIVFLAMMGRPYAAEYMHLTGVPISVALRVLTQPWKRRGTHDEFGFRSDINNFEGEIPPNLATNILAPVRIIYGSEVRDMQADDAVDALQK